MLSKSFVAILSLACLTVTEASAKNTPKVVGTVVDISKDAVDHVKIEPEDDGNTVIFSLKDGYAAEKVVDGSETIKTFDLEKHAPKYITKHIQDGKAYLVIVVEAAYHLAFKKEKEWTSIDITAFHESVFFKGFESIVLDLEKFVDSSLFSVEAFGSGEKYAFEAPNKRASKVVSADKDVVSGDDKLILDACVYAKGDSMIATVWYIYKPDGRIKEVFFQKTEDGWTRVDVTTAAKVLNGMNPDFSTDYKTVYDGFSVSHVFFVAFAIAFSTLFF
ncbi:ema family member protein [Theileria equi strain WA]|uniref:Ema family member protein n=1 Tax=Theileria equi strain WA TaxID=1537102 RepID=L1LD02_THEEQ|nr:ema family member protein [Theileria equi strain WA]EKX73216.1 ema family member protein [Theileria equi strain WA]|eukprot:XP_004832668.1 ema family member protein [Theileria equi strain WA]